MEAQLQRRVQRYGWDRAAPHYNQCWREALLSATAALLRLAALTPGERVLDVACGTGVLSLEAARAVGADGAVVGTDISAKMVAAADAAALALGYRHCTFERRDAEQDPHPGSAFDAALCGLGLMYMPDPERAVAGMVKCLARDGRLVASVWGRRDRCGWASVFPIVDAHVESDVCPMFFRLGACGAMENALSAAGLHDIHAERVTCGLAYRSGDAACDAAFLGGPVALAYARFDAATQASVRADYLQSIAAYREAGGYRIPAEFVVARGSWRQGRGV